MEKETNLHVVTVILAILLALSLWFNIASRQSAKEKTVEKVKVEYVTHKDTHPTASAETVIKTVVDTLPIVRYVNKIARDTILLASEGKKDSVAVKIPITQKTYRDSLYTAYVSGYKPSLDSITVRERIVTHTITVTRTRYKPFSFGIIGGAGYGFVNRKPDVFIGVGGTIHF